MDKPKPKRPRSKPGKANAADGVRKRPLLDLCREAGWKPLHLSGSATTSKELADLLVQELVACREAGKFDLTIALCDLAEARGLVHPRIAANRDRAKLAQEKGGPLVVIPPPAKAKANAKGKAKANAKGKAKPAGSPRGIGFWQHLRFALGLKGRSKGKKQQRPDRPDPQPEAQQPTVLAVEPQQLEALQAVCRKAGWAPQFLNNDGEAGVALACAQEMQRCRQAGQHALVVALAAEAAIHGLEHERIGENLQRSRGKAARANVLAQARGFLKASPPAPEAAATLLANALVAEPDSVEYRKLLVDSVQQQVEQRGGTALAAELRQAAVELEVNERILEALERRKKDG